MDMCVYIRTFVQHYKFNLAQEHQGFSKGFNLERYYRRSSFKLCNGISAASVSL